MHEAVSVLAGYSQKHKVFKPLVLTRNGVDYSLGKIDFYHKTKKGVTTLHHFSLSSKDEAVYFKLLLNGSNLNWTLEEYQMAGETQAHYTN